MPNDRLDATPAVSGGRPRPRLPPNTDLTDTGTEPVRSPPGEGDHLPTGTVMRLQSSAGNAAVSRMLGHKHQLQRTMANRAVVQRAPNASKPEPSASNTNDIHGQIAEAVRAQDPGAAQRVMDRSDFNRATEAEILSLIRLVNSLGGGDPNRLGRLWDSFGERAPAVIAANMADWETTARLWPGVPDLVKAVKRTEDALVATLKSLAEFNLSENALYIKTRLEQFGYAPGGKPLSAEEQRSMRVSMQKVAYGAWQLRQTQEKARRTEIGRSVGRISLPVTFDPAGPRAFEGPASVDVEKWEAIKAEWDTAQTQLNEAAAKFPEIYELLSRRDDNALLNFSRLMPEDAANPAGGSANAKAGEGYQSQGKQLLISLQERIQKAKADLPNVDMLALKPLHERVYAAPGRWNHGFDQWVAKRAVERHARDENTMKVLANMGTGAAALIATFATGGMALAFAAAGAGSGIATAAVAQAEAGRLDTLAKATPLKGTELVSQAQADAKVMEARAEIFAAIIAVIAAAGAAWKVAVETRLTSLVEKAVADPALRGALLTKVADKRVLVRLLQKSDTPTELKLLLEGRDVVAVEKLLDARTGVRNRLGQLRATQGARIDADPALIKQVDAVEEMLKDATRSEDAAKQIESILETLASQGLVEGLNTPVLGVIVDEGKFTYVFGKAAADAHNTPRTLDNARQMGTIGFHDTVESRATIRAHLERVPYEPGNIIESAPGKEIAEAKLPKHSVTDGTWGGPIEVRESLLQGPGGTVKLSSTWEVRYGVRRLTTVIIDGPPKVRPPDRGPNWKPPTPK